MGYLLFFGLLVQLMGFIISITIEDFSTSFFPYPYHVVPLINFLGICVAFFMLLFPGFKLLQSISFFAFGILMTMNNLVFLGGILYSIGLLLLFSNKLMEENPKRKLCFIGAMWGLSLLTLIPHSAYQFFMALAYTLFLIFAYAHIYTNVRESILSLFPITAQNLSTKDLPEMGSSLNLRDLGLTERQVRLTIEFSKNHPTYKELADFIFTSESTVKREMGEIFCKLGVQNSTELGFLLSQYKLLEAES